MGLRFSKSIKIMDGLKMNISKSGVSFTAGKSGKSINLSSKGTYVNLGLPGTGVSYRQKVAGGYSSLLGGLLGNKDTKKTTKKKEVEEKKPQQIENKQDIEKYQQFVEEYDAYINIHKYTENVHSIKDYLTTIEDEQLRMKVIEGDEETVEELIGDYLENLQLVHSINVNYELEDDILYVDLDLPELEDTNGKILELDKNNNVKEKEKSNAQLKKDYCQIVLSLSVFLAINFFNISPFITNIVLSGYTQRRNKIGDLDNEYILSVKFTRDAFEATDITKIDDVYKFICQFENRIILISDNSLKKIEPFEMVFEDKKESLDLSDIFTALKSLGYKNEEVNNIKSELSNMQLEKEDDYLREGLKLLKRNRSL